MKLPTSTNIFPPKIVIAIEHWLAVILFVLSLVTICAIVVDYGFLLNDSELRVVHLIYRLSWWFYLLLYVLQLLFGWRNIRRKSLFLTVSVGVLFILSALLRYLQSDSVDVPFFLNYLFVEKIQLLLLSLLEVSRGIVDFINKKTNPAMLMALCFALLIAVGTILLLFPRSTLQDVRLSVIDAFFISTSAVCVTGLSPIDIAQTFSIEGQIVLMLLIQAGGLGVMTITSFFALFFMGGIGLYNQFALRDMIGSDTFGSLISTLLNIIGFTLLIEFLGALGIWLSVRGTLGLNLQQEFFFSLFHSVSAFCNAGFSTLSNNLGNDAILLGHNTFFLIITLLVVLGSLGYPILVNFKRIIIYYIKQFVARLFNSSAALLRYRHIMNINTKIVLTMSAALFFGAAIVIAVCEWNGAFAGMSSIDKIVQSLFTAAVPRTAGFNSVPLTQFSVISIVFYIFLMWIGGASQSTAGGIKVNTFAVAYANLVSVMRGHRGVMLFGREISTDSLRRASAVIFGSILIIITAFFLLMVLEPDIPARSLLFETISAYSTVGASLDVTPHLDSASKILLALLMFLGRVGFMTVIATIIPPTGVRKFRYPKDNVIIN